MSERAHKLRRYNRVTRNYFVARTVRGYALEISANGSENGREKIFKRAELMVIRRTRSN